MRKISRALGLCACAATVLGEAKDDAASGRELAAIDSQYAKVALEKGMPAASLDYFASDGIAFGPFPLNGKKYWASRKDFPGTLIWQPAFVAVARAGDLGYTTGPWELKKNGEQISLAYGHYLTIWKRQSDTSWKMALDVGTENAQPTSPPGQLEILPPDPTAGERPVAEARQRLRKTIQTFLHSAERNIGNAILTNAAEEIRVCRDQSFPAVGLTAARLMLSSANGKVTRELGAIELSNSADLSYTYGKYSEDRNNTVEHGIYIMIWRIDMNGDWKLVFDLQKKVDQEP